MMKPNYFLRMPRYIWCISLLILCVSCMDDTDTEPGFKPGPEKVPSGYNFVSIEYTLQEALDIRLLTQDFPCENNSDDMVVKIAKVYDYVPLNSVFSVPDEPLKYPDMIKRTRVPLPKLDATGKITGLSGLKLPLQFGNEPAGAIIVTYAPSIVIPAFTTYTLSTVFNGWLIKARYTCTVENNDTKERTSFTGILSSRAFCDLKISFTDAQNNTVDTIEQAVDY